MLSGDSPCARGEVRQPQSRDIPRGTSSRASEMREMAASGLFAGLSPNVSCRVIGSTRRLDRCAETRSRACRSGSMAQQRTLQYFAIRFLTGFAHPRRMQMRRTTRWEAVPSESRPPSTGRSVGRALIDCQRLATRLRPLRGAQRVSTPPRSPVQSVDKCSRTVVRGDGQAVRNVWVEAGDQEFLRFLVPRRASSSTVRWRTLCTPCVSCGSPLRWAGFEHKRAIG